MTRSLRPGKIRQADEQAVLGELLPDTAGRGLRRRLSLGRTTDLRGVSDGFHDGHRGDFADGLSTDDSRRLKRVVFWPVLRSAAF